MKTKLQIHFVLTIILALGEINAAQAQATGFQAGLEAYQRGDYATALTAWKPLAESGDAQAQLRLGGMFAGGQGVPQSLAEAVKWYTGAARQNVVEAEYLLGLAYQNGGPQLARNPAEALRWYQLAAEHGSPNAQHIVGLAYQSGEAGVPTDLHQAMRWFRLAAEQRHADAQLNLAMLLAGLRNQPGMSVEENLPESIQWYERAAEQGVAQAEYNLGRMAQFGIGMVQDYAGARKRYQAAYGKGMNTAAFDIAGMHEFGRGGPVDLEQAARWYAVAASARHAAASLWVAAERKDAEAQYRLALVYLKGDAVPQDFRAAEKWLKRAADQSHAGAELNLGLLHLAGKGLKKNEVAGRQLIGLSASHGSILAQLWLAAEKGNAAAQVKTGLQFLTGDQLPPDSDEALRWFEKAAVLGDANGQFQAAALYHARGEYAAAAKWYRAAANQSHSDAQTNLAILYASGRGVPQDYSEAAKWNRRAAKQGAAGAQFNLGMMYIQGAGVSPDPLQAYAWFSLAAANLEEARIAIQELEKQLSPEQLNSAKSLTPE